MNAAQDSSADGGTGRRAVVIIASTRAATGVYPDRTGPILTDWLRNNGFDVSGPIVVADGEPVGAALQAAVVDAEVVITSGGTGISPTDVTPQQTGAVLDYEIPGLAEALRRRGVDAGMPTAMLSRGLAGVAGRCLVVNLPGSTGGVRDALAVLDGVLGHALDQLAGADHPSGNQPTDPEAGQAERPAAGQPT